MQRLKKPLIGLTVNQPCNALAVIPRYVKQSKVEHFGLIVMDGGRRIIDYRVLYKGGTGNCVVDIKPILWEMAKQKAVCGIVFHNHPSGIMEPSEEDKDLTKRLESAFNVCGYSLLDHVIVSKDEYYSFKENGALTSEEKLEEKVADLLRG